MKRSNLGKWEKHTVPILSADEIDNSDDDDGIINQRKQQQKIKKGNWTAATWQFEQMIHLI